VADWRSLAQKLALVDDCIESQDARVIREELLGEGKIDKPTFDFLISLRREAKSVAFEFDEMVFDAVKRVHFENGSISPEGTQWLKTFLGAKGSLSKHERAFLEDVMNSARPCPEFLDWCKTLGIHTAAIDRWYYAQHKNKIGPVSLVQLRRLREEGVLKSEDMVVQEGAAKWCPLAEVAGQTHE
jgi:hypothetical protein